MLQVSTVGVTESKFSTGVVIPQVFEGAVGQMAGIQEGDTIMKLNGRFLKPSMTAVNDLVNYIKYALLQPFQDCTACSHGAPVCYTSLPAGCATKLCSHADMLKLHAVHSTYMNHLRDIADMCGLPDTCARTRLNHACWSQTCTPHLLQLHYASDILIGSYLISTALAAGSTPRRP